MWSRLAGGLNAAMATLLVVGIGAIAFSPLLYLLIMFIEGLLEAIGLIATGWGRGHGREMTWAAAILIVLPALYLGWRCFRRALEVERELRGDRDPPAPA